MPTIFTHAVLPLAFGLALGRKTVSPRLIAAGMAASVLPDADVVAFAFGIPYEHAFGHRGASHSLAFALAIGVFGALIAPWLRSGRWRACLWLSLWTASHPLLDMLTNGGLGMALLWPWSEARLFAPWRPIQVSPIGAGFFSARGLAVLWSEFLWVWLPALAMAAAIFATRAATARHHDSQRPR